VSYTIIPASLELYPDAKAFLSAVVTGCNLALRILFLLKS
jgi:hypothetical protein